MSYGVSAAYRFANGLAIGGGLAVSTFSIGQPYRLLLHWSRTGADSASGPPSVHGSGSGFRSAGFQRSQSNRRRSRVWRRHQRSPELWCVHRPAGGKWTAGGAFRRGPKFEYNTEFRWGPVQDRFPGPPNSGDLYDSDHVTFKIPDTYSFGKVGQADRSILLLSLAKTTVCSIHN